MARHSGLPQFSRWTTHCRRGNGHRTTKRGSRCGFNSLANRVKASTWRAAAAVPISYHRGVTFETNEAVASLYRSDWGRIVATLIRLIGDFDVAEEAAQEAFTAAVNQWPESGIPEYPRAWIIETARHKAIDQLRRWSRAEEKLEAYAAEEASM